MNLPVTDTNIETADTVDAAANDQTPPVILAGNVIEVVQQFTYLGCEIAPMGGTDEDVR